MALGVTGSIMNMLPGQRYDPKKGRIKARKKFSTEWRMNRGELDSLNQNRNQNEGAARDLNAITPTLYSMAGLEGEFGPTAQNSQRVAQAQAAVDATPPGARKKAAQKKLAKEQDSVAEQAQSLKPGTVRNVGLGDENDRAIDKALAERVRVAAETGQSNDPRLNRELNEQTAALERGIGERGLAGSSLGATAMATDSQRRSESLADFARRDITEFNPLRLQQRETLADIAGKRMDLALKPIKARLGVGEAMGATAGRFGTAASRYQMERFKDAEQREQAEQFRSQHTIGSSLMQVGGAVGAYATATGGSRSPDSLYEDAMARNERSRQGNSGSSWFSSTARTAADFFR